MKQVKTALIGCGKIGLTHALALSALNESDFVAVCDAQLSRAQAFADRFHVQAFDSVPEMLRQANVEAVTICTPHPLHEELACRRQEAARTC